MSPLIVLLLVIAAPTAFGKGSKKRDEQPADGSPDFIYFSKEGKEAGEKLHKLLLGMDDSVAEFVEKLKQTNNASTSLNIYKEAVESVKGTKCAVSTEDQDQFNDAQEEIEEIIRTCAAFVSQGDREALKNIIREGVAKIQTWDNTLKLNSNICSSLRAPPSSSCVETKEKALKGIEHAVSQGEMGTYYYYLRNTYFNTVDRIACCVESDTGELQEEIKESTRSIVECNV